MIKPMLAHELDMEYLTFPVYCSPKIDGIRGILTKDGMYSRSGKLFPNVRLQKWSKEIWERYSLEPYRFLDGELISNDFRQTTSVIMAAYGGTAFIYKVFDCGIEAPYEQRLREIEKLPEIPNLEVVSQMLVTSPKGIHTAYELFIACGFEGAMVRNPKAFYKHGRSKDLLKMKQFQDEEGVIIACHELLINNNPAYLDELGYTKRSASKENKAPSGMLGAFEVENPKYSKSFKVGSGFDENQRVTFWRNRKHLIGVRITYKYQPHGTVDVPRMPVFKGFRFD